MANLTPLLIALKESIASMAGSIKTRFTNVQDRVIQAHDGLLQKKQTTVIVIGDSLTRGSILADSREGWVNLFANSLYELHDNVDKNERSVGYPVMFNMEEMNTRPDITHNGEVGFDSAISLSGSNVRLRHGTFIELTDREASVVTIYYDNTVFAGNAGVFEIYLNGELKGTRPVLATGFNKTEPFVLTKLAGDPVISTDKVKIVYKSTAANAAHLVCVVGLSFARPNTNNGPVVLNVNHPGWTYENFMPLLPKIAQVAEWNKFDDESDQVYLVYLTGNAMYNQSYIQTPVEMAASLNTMVTTLGINGTTKRLIPIFHYLVGDGVAPLGTHSEYLAGVKAVCKTHGLMLLDLTDVKLGLAFFPDGIHPTAPGYAALASHICAGLGIPFNPKNQAKDLAALTRKTDLIDMNPVWWPNDVDVTEMINGPSRTVHAYGTHRATNGLPEDIGGEVGVVTFTRTPNGDTMGFLKCQSYLTAKTWYKGKFGTWGPWIESEQTRAFKMADNDRFRVIQAPDLLLQEKQTTVTIIGDSLSSGFSLPHSDLAWPTLFSNSLFEAFDNPDTGKRSVGYQTMFNMKEAANCRGMTTNGTFIEQNTHTISGQGLILKHNQFLEVTGREASVLTVYYDNDAVVGKAGVFEYYLNDELKGSVPVVTSAGFKKTEDFVLTKLLNYPVISTDTVKIVYKAASANANHSICMVGLQLIRPKTNQGAVVLNINHPGWNFTQFNSRLAKINQAVAWHNNSSATDQVYLAFMGANSWWSGVNNQSPEDLVASIKTMAGGLGINGKDKRMVIWMNYIIEPGWPAIGSYNDFLKALQKLATEEGYGFIDCSTLKMQPHFYPADIHPTEAGHAMLAQHICKNLGVSYNPKNQAKDLAVKVQQLAEVTSPTQWWPPGLPITDIVKGPSRTVIVLANNGQAAELPPEAWDTGVLVTYVKTPGSPGVELIKAQDAFGNRRWVKTKFGTWSEWLPDANVTLPPRLDALEGPMTWTDLTVLSPWTWPSTDVFKPAYAVRGGRVYLRGNLKILGEQPTFPNGSHLFTLPESVRPAKASFGLCAMSAAPFFFGSCHYMIAIDGSFKILTPGPNTPVPITDFAVDIGQLSFDLSP